MRNTENTATSIAVFTARCIATEIIRLLPAYRVRCLTVDILLFRAFASAGMCLATRCLAMGVCVTLSFNTPLHACVIGSLFSLPCKNYVQKEWPECWMLAHILQLCRDEGPPSLSPSVEVWPYLSVSSHFADNGVGATRTAVARQGSEHVVWRLVCFGMGGSLAVC
jgi:hypothetical protein